MVDDWSRERNAGLRSCAGILSAMVVGGIFWLCFMFVIGRAFGWW